jgi:hypothetical protein
MVALRDDGRGQGHRRGEGPRAGAPRLRIVEPARAGAPLAEPPLPLVRRDTLPEHADYTDTGCELAPSCLRCPFPRCQYDEPGGARRVAMTARDREIARLRRRYGAPIDPLAGTYRLSRRSIFRILREASEGQR